MSSLKTILASFGVSTFALGAILLGLSLSVGCSDEREVLDVETPDGEIEVNEDTDTGELDMEVDDNDGL